MMRVIIEGGHAHSAIEARKLADARAKAAADTAARAFDLMREAGDAAEKLRAGLFATQRSAKEKHAKAISEAIRAGSPIPTAPPIPETSSAPSAAAMAHFHALEQAAAELSAERDEAKAEADHGGDYDYDPDDGEEITLGAGQLSANS